MSLRRNLYIIYDGKCAFCIRTLRVVKKLDAFGALEFYDFHDQETLKEKFPMVRREDAEEAMIAVTQDFRVFKGFYAFRRLIWVSPWLWPLALLFYSPGSAYLGTRLYGWVARNRRNFGCRADSREIFHTTVAPASQDGNPERLKDRKAIPL